LLSAGKPKEERKVMIAQIAPAVRVAIAEAIGLNPGEVSVGQLVAGLRQLGFDYVFGESCTLQRSSSTTGVPGSTMKQQQQRQQSGWLSACVDVWLVPVYVRRTINTCVTLVCGRLGASPAVVGSGYVADCVVFGRYTCT
jgi:iron only hydrogenase large subunit-like protein